MIVFEHFRLPRSYEPAACGAASCYDLGHPGSGASAEPLHPYRPPAYRRRLPVVQFSDVSAVLCLQVSALRGGDLRLVMRLSRSLHLTLASRVLTQAVLHRLLVPSVSRWLIATTRGGVAHGLVPSDVLARATIAQPARSTGAFCCASCIQCRNSNVLHLQHHHLPARVALH